MRMRARKGGKKRLKQDGPIVDRAKSHFKEVTCLGVVGGEEEIKSCEGSAEERDLR